MKELLEFILKNITGSDDFTVDVEETEDGQVTLIVYADPSIIGLIIGKEGKTIKSIRRIVSIRASLEDKAVRIDVRDKEEGASE